MAKRTFAQYQSMGGGDDDITADDLFENEFAPQDPTDGNDFPPPPSQSQQGDNYSFTAQSNEPEYVPVRHPGDVETERKLGPHVPADEYCFICQIVDQSNIEKVGDKVIELMNFIDTGRRTCNDIVEFAGRVKDLFDKTIRLPTNTNLQVQQFQRAPANNDSMDPSVGESSPPLMPQDSPGAAAAAWAASVVVAPIKEWTLRSIINHMMKVDTSPIAQLDRGAIVIDRMIDVINNTMFVADKTKVNADNTTEPQNIKLGDRECAKMVALLRTSLAFNKARLEQSSSTLRPTNNNSGTGPGTAVTRAGPSGQAALSSANLRRRAGNGGSTTKRPVAAASISAVPTSSDNGSRTLYSRRLFV
jgi:hypothetical protein